MVHLSHLHMNARKTMTLTVWAFVGKVMSYLNVLVAFPTFFNLSLNFTIRSS